MSAACVYIGLVHYPVYNKKGELIATSVTNLDLHDISRIGATYAVAGYLVIHPHLAQQRLVAEILHYWVEGYGAEYNPDRKQALQGLTTVSSLAEAIGLIERNEGRRPKIVTTDARLFPNSIGYCPLRRKISTEEGPWLLLFGTGFGLDRQTTESADYILEPVWGRGEYNHLSVRSAVAIILDRLLGPSFLGDKEN
ncbi:MAG: RNA methyltransferase [Heliobacteriaceae bacterium]|nr:RNA methyltransferase [Heliobacteriaceae bacterium]